MRNQSPFKFLAPYQQEDVKIFYGRNEDTNKLVKAFKKSSFVILYGPSGSGKSSLINCGLLKNLQKKYIFEIRRNGHILQSINNSLFASDATQKEGEFITIIKSIALTEKKIAESYSNINQWNAQIIQKQLAFQRRQLSKEKLELVIKGLTQSIQAVEKQLLIDKELRTQQKKKLEDLFSTFLWRLKVPPYLIFDQFEELFLLGTKQEIEEFGTFLSSLLTSKLSIKILISIREEYFSKLSKFESFLPQILYRKSLLDNPDRQCTFNIIKESFSTFNINQYFSHNHHLPIPEEEQEKRINLILDHLADRKEGEANDEQQEQSFHLPFLQIYLDKLYKEDFKRTYPDQAYSDQVYPIIEFEPSEIKNFGDINKVLLTYINEVDKELIEAIEIDDYTTEFTHSLGVRFLKNFATKEDTKERIKISSTIKEEDSIYYTIENPTINKKIQQNTWGIVGKNDHKVSQYIQKLRAARLLKVSDNYVELSHDILAKVVNAYSIERTLKEILKDRFNTYFEEYYAAGQQAGHLFKEAHIASYDNYRLLPFILSDPDPAIQIKKKDYWQKSLKKINTERDAESKKKTEAKNREIRAQEQQIKKLRRRNSMIGLLLALALFVLLFAIRQYNELEIKAKDLIEAEAEAKTQKEKSDAHRNVNEGTATAFRDLKTDRTKSYRKLIDSEKQFESIWVKLIKRFTNTTPTTSALIGDFKNDIFRDFNKYPFYSKEIKLETGNKNQIIRTKHLLVKNYPDSAYIYILSNNNDLFEVATNYKTVGTIRATKKVSADVKAFVPYYYGKKDQIGLLVVKNNQLYRKNQDTLGLIEMENLTIDLQQTAALIQLSKNRFVTNTLGKIIEFSLKDATSIGRVIQKFTFQKPIQDIQKDDTTAYVVVSESGKLFHSKTGNDLRGEQGIINRPTHNQNSLPHPSVSWQLDKITQHNHDDAITSIAHFHTPQKELWLLGSQDRTASIWEGKKEKKRLIGHTDQVLQVDFLSDTQEDYVLTASADGTLKIWDLRSIERKHLKIKEASTIKKLVSKEADSLLYVGFTFKDYQQPGGYLYAYCENLADSCRHKIEQYKLENDVKGHITAFAFDSDTSLVLSGFENKLIASATADGNHRLAGIQDPFPTITDIGIKDTMLVAATEEGLLYFPNYKHSPQTVLTALKEITCNAIAIHPSKPLVLAAAENNHLYIWNLERQTIDTLIGHFDQVQDAVFSKTGQFIVSGSWDNTAIVWKFEDDKYVFQEKLVAHTNDIEDVEFQGDTLILTASSDNTVQLFQFHKDAAKANKEKKADQSTENEFKQIPSLIRHETKITAATFSADGQYIYTGDNRGTIKKWAFQEFESDLLQRVNIE